MNLQPNVCEIQRNTCAWHDNHTIQSVHTTRLQRRNFSWIPGKQILNPELLAGGFWCIFLNHYQCLSASYLFPACGSLFLNHQLFREAERGNWDSWKNPFFCPLIAQLCLMLAWHVEQLRAGMDILGWGWAQPNLALGFTNSSPFIISYPKTLFYFL